MKNYYEILEVNKNASPEVLEKAYKALVIKYHPDRWTSNKSFAEHKIKEINEAYDVLSSVELRKKYDMQIEAQINLEKMKAAQSNAKYTDLYTENRKLKQELNNIKTGNYKNVNIRNFQSGIMKVIEDFIIYQKNKTKQDHLNTLYALGLTIVIVFFIVLAFNKIPFLNNILKNFP